jgi:Asp-tRNA(Asn)/Glu-tRNA(Gln) amidotransferase A subunit family amidase
MMLSALDLARRIDAGSISPSDVFDLCAKAIATRGGNGDTFVVCETNTAFEHSRDTDGGSGARHLRGLPIAVKDVFDTAELPTAYGSRLYTGHRPRADATLVAQARRAGGVVIGKTTTTEFGLELFTQDRNHDQCGAAVAVAAGLVPVAIGSQTDEAIIRPASAHGIAGYKPSFKILPTVGLKCVSWHLDTAGLFAAGVADVAFAAAAITSRDLFVDEVIAVAPSIGVIRKAGYSVDDTEAERMVDCAARLAEAAGAQVREVALPEFFYDATCAHTIIKQYEAYRALAYEFDHHRDLLSPETRAMLDDAAKVDADSYDSTRRTTRRTRLTFAELIKEFDVLISPATGINQLWTLLGTPCLSVPGLSDSAGRPSGIQVIGRFGRDRAVLSAGRFLEQTFAGAERDHAFGSLNSAI